MVLRVSLDMVLQEFEADLYTDALYNDMMSIMEDGAYIFFMTATLIMENHVDTGMAISAYTGLAAYLHQTIDGLSLRNTYKPPKKYKPPGAAEMLKLPESGAFLSSKQGELFKMDISKRMVRFDFYTDVWHYKLMDPQWKSIQAANDAMLLFVSQQLARVPAIDKYMTRYYYRTTNDGSTITEKVRARKQRTTRRRRRP